MPRAGDEGPVRVLVSRPVKLPGPPLPAIVWLHGGGFVIGSPEQDQRLLERIAGDVGCVVAAPDYRLAPETPYPGALRDCSAVLRWLHEQPDRLGVDPTRLAVGGHSAGGGLAAAVALEARERGGPVLALQALVYPMLDDRTASQAPQERPFAGEFVWDHPTNAAAWGALLGESVGTPGVSPLAAPARAADLSKVAPALVVVGALDLLVDEAVVYASRLVRAGVPTTLHLYAGAVHGTLDASGTAPGEAMRIELVTALQVALLGEVHHRAPRNGSAEVHQPAHREPRIRRLS